MRLRLLVWGLSVAAMLAACGDGARDPAPTAVPTPSGPTAEPSPTVEPPFAPELRHPPTDDDIAWYAERFGIHPAAAEERLADLGTLLNGIEETAPGRAAGAWLVHEPAEGAVVWFTGGEEGLDDARRLASVAPLPIEIRSGARFTHEELSATISIVSPLIGSRDGVSGLGVDVPTGTIFVHMTRFGGASADPEELRQRLQAVTEVPIRIEVTETDVAVDPDDRIDEWPLALVPASGGGDDALIEGRLVLEGNCLYIEDAAGARTFMIFEYPGTQWDEAAQAVVANGEPLPVGSTARFGGGGGPLPNPGNHDWIKAPGPSCDTSSAWFANVV